MLLNQTIAEQIIDEIRPVLKEDVNIMNEKGIILDSTAKNRIGTYHGGAYQLIESGRDELIIYSDDQYEGCRKGVNFPIRIQSEIIGVVGVTGEPEDVYPYGLMIKKMTELIIVEITRTEEVYDAQQEMTLVIQDLVRGNLPYISENSFLKRMKRHGFDPSGIFTAAILKNTKRGEIRDPESIEYMKMSHEERQIITELSSSKVHFAYDGRRYIAAANMKSDDFCERIKKTEEYYREHFGGGSVRLLCAVGSSYREHTNAYKSYNEAKAVMEYYMDRERGVFGYRDVPVEFTLQQIPKLYKDNISNRVFSDCSPEEEKEFRRFIRIYFDMNGSLKKISEAYYIHKNTIQYKIQKIREKTSFDIRTNEGLLMLYLASLFGKEEQ